MVRNGGEVARSLTDFQLSALGTDFGCLLANLLINKVDILLLEISWRLNGMKYAIAGGQ